MNLRIASPLLLACLLPAAAGVHAAESLEACTGFIDSAATVVGSQGVWCLRKDLSTSMTSGAAITIAANNVTIDCNGYKIGGLGGGELSGASGIKAVDRQNATVRNCSVRGFMAGIHLSGGSGHLVEDNRLDNNILYGILLDGGDNNTVRRNRVFDTGGYPAANYGVGIVAYADVIDNTVSGVFAAGGVDTYPTGIAASADGAEIRGNRVRGLAVAGAGFATGINVNGAGANVADNSISAEAPISGTGISGGTSTACTGNLVFNFSVAYSACAAGAGNLTLP